MLNFHDLIEQDHQEMEAQIGGFCLSPTNLISTFAPHQQPSFKPFTTLACPFDIDHATSTLTQALLSSTCPKPRHDPFVPSNLPPLGSFPTCTPNSWAWGEGKEYQEISKRSVGGVSSTIMKMKKIKGRRKMREPRFCFKTMSDVDVLDDGYKWRKYGQKVVKNTLHPRSYYRCTQDKCKVKKRVERLAEDPRMVITTYEGRHVHSPSHHLHDPLTNFFF